MSKKLVTYLSASGVTARLAKTIAQAADAELYEIRPAQPYTSADLNWMDRKSRSTVEMKDESCRPALADTDAPVAEAEVVFVGFPIWWGREPSVVDTFLDAYDFTGKTVVVYATSGGSRMGKTASRIQGILGKDTKVVDGKVLRSGSSVRDMEKWLKDLGV